MAELSDVCLIKCIEVVRKQAHAVPNYDQCGFESAVPNYDQCVAVLSHAVPNYDQCTGELRGGCESAD